MQFICDFSRLHEGLHEKLTLEGSQKSSHRYISSCHRCLCIVRTNVFMLYKTIFLCWLLRKNNFKIKETKFTIYLKERNHFRVLLKTANGVLHAQTNWRGISESTRVQNLSCAQTAVAHSPEQITWPLISDATADLGGAWSRNRESHWTSWKSRPRGLTNENLSFRFLPQFCFLI